MTRPHPDGRLPSHRSDEGLGPRGAVTTLLLLSLLTGLPAAAQPAGTGAGRSQPDKAGPKIYISFDIEGVTTVVNEEQLGPTGFEYNAIRRIATEEVLAAIEGARAAGAGEILVSDSHGNGLNLIPDLLPDDIRLIRSWPRPLEMMEGIDETFDGVFLIGYHAGTTNPEGVRAHSFSSANLTDVKLNGRSVPEAVWNAAIAGQFGVPVLLLSGDDAIDREARAFLPDLETAVVKRAISYHSAETMTPQAARDLIREKARLAVTRIGDHKPYRVTAPLEVEIRFKNYRPAQLLAYLPLFERIDSHAIRYRARDMAEATRLLVFILSYQIGLQP